jgi:hypothetical protein
MIEIITHHEFKDTTPEQVWRILTHFESYSEWNPFIIKANQVNDKSLVITTQVIDDKPQTFQPTIMQFQPYTELSWTGQVGSKYLLKAEHRFSLKVTNGNTRLTHSETFSGLISCIINQDKQNKIKKSFENMNAALEERIHHLSQGAQP